MTVSFCRSDGRRSDSCGHKPAQIDDGIEEFARNLWTVWTNNRSLPRHPWIFSFISSSTRVFSSKFVISTTTYSSFQVQPSSKASSRFLFLVASIALLLISAYIFDPILKKWFASFKFPMELLLVFDRSMQQKTECIRWYTVLSGWNCWKIPVGLSRRKCPSLERYCNEMDYCSFLCCHSLEYPNLLQVTFGLYSPRVPSMTNVTKMLGHSISIAIISFAIHIALAKLIAKQMEYQVNSNQVTTRTSQWIIQRILGMVRSRSNALLFFLLRLFRGRILTR